MTKHYAANEYMEEYQNMNNYKVKLSDGTVSYIKALSGKQARSKMVQNLAHISVMGINPPEILEVSLDE